MHEADIETRGIARPKRHNPEGVLLAIRRALVTVTHGNLVVATVSIEADEE